MLQRVWFILPESYDRIIWNKKMGRWSSITDKSNTVNVNRGWVNFEVVRRGWYPRSRNSNVNHFNTFALWWAGMDSWTGRVVILKDIYHVPGQKPPAMTVNSAEFILEFLLPTPSRCTAARVTDPNLWLVSVVIVNCPRIWGWEGFRLGFRQGFSH